MNLKEALWLCCQNFNTKRARHKDRDFHRIWIFTDDDDPNASQPEEQTKALTIARDANDSGGEISLWYIGSDFRVDKFYLRLLCLDNEEELLYRATEFEQGRVNLSQLRKKHLAKRSLATLPFILGKDLQITVQLFKTLEITKKPAPTYLYRVTNEALRVSSRYIDFYGSRVDPLRIKTYLEVGGRRVYISGDEMAKFKFGGGATGSLSLLRFVHADQLTLDLNIQAPYFIFPDDSTTNGSSHLFSAILRDVHSKGLIGIGELVRARASSARFVALLPQLEKFDESGYQIDCFGFNVIPLPFLGESRQMYSPPMQEAFEMTTASTVKAAEDLISAFQLEDNFEYAAVENPSIQKYFAVLQAVALSEESIEWSRAQDRLQPCVEDFPIFEDLFQQFKKLLKLGDSEENDMKRVKLVRYYRMRLNILLDTKARRID